MSNELMKYEEIKEISQDIVDSTYFLGKGKENISQARIKVLAGQSLGLGPIPSMSIEISPTGKIILPAVVMASLIKGSAKYNYLVDADRHTNDICSISFFERGKKIGESTFSMDDAKMAGLGGKDTYLKYPRNMLFARAMSNGVKWFCSDVFNGPVYVPGEIDEIENDENFVVEQLPEKIVSENEELIINYVKLLDGSPKEKLDKILEMILQGNLHREGEPITIADIIKWET